MAAPFSSVPVKSDVLVKGQTFNADLLLMQTSIQSATWMQLFALKYDQAAEDRLVHQSRG